MSIVIPSSKTLTLDLTEFSPYNEAYPQESWTEWNLNLNWKKSEKWTEFNLNQFKILFVSKIRFSLVSVNLSPHEYKVLSSAKLQN